MQDVAMSAVFWLAARVECGKLCIHLFSFEGPVPGFSPWFATEAEIYYAYNTEKGVA
jgi:hypothetical protein